MALATYTDLQASVGNWLNRSDLAAVAPDFIALAETEIKRTLRTRDSLVRAITEISVKFSALPTDFREMKAISLQGVVESHGSLEFRTYDRMQLEWARTNGTLGQPKYYTILGDSIGVAPIPDSVYIAEMGYYSEIPSLSVASPANWLLAKHPDLYLYGSLLQSAPYLKDDTLIQVWQDKYNSIISSIQMEEERASYSGSTPRVQARSIG